jgi:probable DNA metabolism protein
MEQLKLIETEEEVKDYDEDVRQLSRCADPVAREMFRREVSLALLNKSPAKYLVIDKAIEQARTKGIGFVLCKVSDEARKFMKLAREVGAEKYRATAFMRLTPIDRHKVLFGEFETQHQTAELIMLHFMRRFPQNNIMIVFGDEAYIGRNKEIFREKIDRKKIVLPKETDEYEKYWLAFYRSQFIPERKNLRYLKRMIPKKYWKWVTELKEFGLA